MLILLIFSSTFMGCLNKLFYGVLPIYNGGVSVKYALVLMVLDIAEPIWPRRSPRMAKSQHPRRSQVLTIDNALNVHD